MTYWCSSAERGREKREGRKPDRTGTDLTERARGEGTGRSGSSSLFRAEYFFVVLILGARILSCRHNYCQCV